MYYIILIIVLTSMTTISLSTKYVKQELSLKEGTIQQGNIKEYQLYIIAAIGGAVGNVMLYFSLKELREIDKTHKYRFIIINTLLILVNALIIYLLVHFNIIKL